MKKKSKWRIVLCSFVIVLLLVIAGGMIFLFLGQDGVLKTGISDIPFSSVKDGTYTGRFDGYRWSNTLEVTVKEGRVTALNVVRDQMVSDADVTRRLFSEVIDGQSLQVDAVTGATVTCKAYLKAMENALLSGK